VVLAAPGVDPPAAGSPGGSACGRPRAMAAVVR
jgi:hypothetical protein